jgi:hypothetical protein
VVVAHGNHTIVQRFWTEGSAVRYLDRTWPNYDPSKIRVERLDS